MMRHTIYKNVMPFDSSGLQIRELTPADSQSLSIAEIEIAPGVEHKMARSTKSDKLYVCIEGQVRFQVENDNVELQPNDALLIRKGQWFNYHNLSRVTSRVILVHVPPFDLECEEFQDEKGGE